MRNKTIVCWVLAVGLAAGLSGCATEREEKGEPREKEARLQAQAKLTRAEAEKIALSKVPGGTIKEGELEKEKRKLIWSFDISVPGSKDIREVQVDAISGEIVAMETETPAAQKKEKEEDEKEGKK